MLSICTHMVDSGPQQKTPLGKTLILFPWRYLGEINIWLHIPGTFNPGPITVKSVWGSLGSNLPPSPTIRKIGKSIVQ